MTGNQRDNDVLPADDLAALTEDQRNGVTCINCATSGGRMRPMLTPDGPRSAMVFFHADTAVCVRRVARYVASLHTRLVDIAEHAGEALIRADEVDDT